MDAVSLKLARNYTNEKLNSLPSNRPTKTVSFDGGIYSVGNDVVNGQVNVILKGNTWTNRAGVGDTSPQTITSLDSAKTYLLIKTDGGTVNVDGVDTAVPAKITGKTSTVLTWASGKIALYELSTTEAALDAAVLSQKYHYVSGTKSTISASRLKSVGKNLFDKSKATLGYRVEPNGALTLNVNVFISDFIPVKATVTYRRTKFYGSWQNRVVFYDSNKVFISEVTSSASIVAPTNAKFIRFNGALVDIDGEQLEEGTTATEYEPYKESSAIINLPEPLRSLPNSVKDEVNVTSGIKTQRVGNKTNVASGTVINYADMATGGQFVAYYADGTQQVGVKGGTLTALATTLIYQLATPIVTKLPVQAPLQVFENGTVYVEPIGDASESTLPSVEMTIPTGTSNKFGVASHDYDGAAADWTLTNSESKCFMLAVSSAGGAANIIAPNRPGTMYAISNASGYAITIKKSGGTGVAVTNAKTVLVIHNGTDYSALTAEL